MATREVYYLYKHEYPADTVVLSMLKSLCPDVVVCKDKMPHHVCVCQYHENIDCLLHGLRHVPSIPATYSGLFQQVSCDPDSEQCMFGECDDCKELSSLESLIEATDDMVLGDQIKWLEWVHSQDGQPEKVEKAGTVTDALTSLAQKLGQFKIHCYIKSKQAAAFRELHTSPGPQCAVLQVNFSENASIIEQEEVHSEHWNHKQVTVFTAVAWTREHTSLHAAVSDNLSHDKYAAAIMIETVLDKVQAKQTEPVNQVDIFSDGASQHFKQKYMMTYITSLLQSKGLTVNWHFFAATHGEGAVDGVGGTVKRAVHSMFGEWDDCKELNLVKSAEQYAECANQHTNIEVLYIPTELIEARKPALDAVWSGATAIPAMHSVHCVRTTGFGQVLVAKYSQQQGTQHTLVQQPIPIVPAIQAAPAMDKWQVAETLIDNVVNLYHLPIPDVLKKGRTKQQESE